MQEKRLRSPSDSASLNTELVGELKNLLGEDFPELVQTYRRDSGVLAEQTRELLAAKEADQLRRVAHSLKGSASNMGATRLAACWASVEDLAGQSNVPYDQIEYAIAAADREFEVVGVLLATQIS